MVTVTFIKSPTGRPWFLGYSSGDQGMVSPQKAKALLEAGMIAPIHLEDEISAAETFTTAARIQEAISQKDDLTTTEGVKRHFGEDIQAMKGYCTKNNVKFHKASKRPEYFWDKIAKHNR